MKWDNVKMKLDRLTDTHRLVKVLVYCWCWEPVWNCPFSPMGKLHSRTYKQIPYLQRRTVWKKKDWHTLHSPIHNFPLKTEEMCFSQYVDGDFQSSRSFLLRSLKWGIWTVELTWRCFAASLNSFINCLVGNKLLCVGGPQRVDLGETQLTIVLNVPSLI